MLLLSWTEKNIYIFLTCLVYWLETVGVRCNSFCHTSQLVQTSNIYNFESKFDCQILIQPTFLVSPKNGKKRIPGKVEKFPIQRICDFWDTMLLNNTFMSGCMKNVSIKWSINI